MTDVDAVCDVGHAGVLVRSLQFKLFRDVRDLYFGRATTSGERPAVIRIRLDDSSNKDVREWPIFDKTCPVHSQRDEAN